MAPCCKQRASVARGDVLARRPACGTRRIVSCEPSHWRGGTGGAQQILLVLRLDKRVSARGRAGRGVRGPHMRLMEGKGGVVKEPREARGRVRDVGILGLGLPLRRDGCEWRRKLPVRDRRTRVPDQGGAASTYRWRVFMPLSPGRGTWAVTYSAAGLRQDP